MQKNAAKKQSFFAFVNYIFFAFFKKIMQTSKFVFCLLIQLLIIIITPKKEMQQRKTPIYVTGD